MATIVREARDPWWANLAVNVLGGLWNDYQQREQNEKLHALEGEIASAINGLAGGQDTDTNGGLMGNAGSNFGAGLGSAGGNIAGGNGWENAFHQSDNPLAEYDANMAGIAPTAQAQGQATPTQATAQAVPVTAITRRQPTSQEILNAFAGLMSSKRFSGVNPKAAQDLLTPYLTLNENARAEQRRKKIAEAYMNAPDDASRLGELYRGVIEGYVPQSVLTSGQGRYQYDNPYQQAYTQNTGQETRYGSFNPRTGVYTEAGHYKNELTPQQLVAMAQHDATLAENRRQFNSTMEYNREGREIAQRNADRAFEADQNAIKGTVLGDDGTLYIMRGNGKHEKFDPNSVGLSNIERTKIDYHKGRIVELRTEYNNLLTARERLKKEQAGGVAEGLKDGEQANPQMEEINQRLESIEKEVTTHENEISNILNSKMAGRNVQRQGQEYLPPVGQSAPISSNTSSSSSTNLGFSLLGNVKGLKISNNGHFGADRKDHTHKGIDISGVPEGTDITLPAEMGDTFKVTRADKSTSYGNVVYLETQRNGHTIEYRIAHMKDGSFRVKKGDTVNAGSVIGQVGNTGRSKGAHVHFEIRVDGTPVDPATFLSKYGNVSSRNISQTTPRALPPVEAKYTDDTPMFRTQDGEILTKSRVDGWVREAENGKLTGIKNREELYREFERRGIKPISSDVSGLQSADISPASPNMTILGSGDVAQVSPDITILGSGDIVATSPDQSPAPVYAEAVNHATSADIQQGIDALNGGTTSGENYYQYPFGDLAYRGPVYANPMDDPNIVAIPNVSADENPYANMLLLGNVSPWVYANRQRFPLYSIAR